MMDKESIRNLHTPIHSWESVKIISGLITVLKQGRPPAPGGKFRLILNITYGFRGMQSNQSREPIQAVKV